MKRRRFITALAAIPVVGSVMSWFLPKPDDPTSVTLHVPEWDADVVVSPIPERRIIFIDNPYPMIEKQGFDVVILQRPGDTIIPEWAWDHRHMAHSATERWIEVLRWQYRTWVEEGCQVASESRLEAMAWKTINHLLKHGEAGGWLVQRRTLWEASGLKVIT